MNRSIINGVKIVKLNQINHPKGKILHMIKKTSPEFKKFGECYMSEINPGCIKAWKLHLKQTQNISVPIGEIKVVLFDSRVKSSTYNILDKFSLGRPDKYHRLTIPPGIIYGFKCVSKESAIILNITDFQHDLNEAQTLALDDSKVPFNWKSI